MKKHPPRLGSSLKAELNVTPLVDVVLVLLIIFMVVTPMLKNTAVELPRAHTVEKVRQAPAPISITVTVDKALLLGAEPLPQAQLVPVMQRVLAGNPNVEIYVKGDKRLKFKDVKTVLDRLQQAGAKRLALAAAEEK